MNSIVSFVYGMLASPVFAAALLCKWWGKERAGLMIVGTIEASGVRLISDLTNGMLMVKPSSATVGVLVGLLIIELALLSGSVLMLSVLWNPINQ